MLKSCIIEELATEIHTLRCNNRVKCSWDTEEGYGSKKYSPVKGEHPIYYKLADEIASDWDEVVSPKALINIFRRISNELGR